MTRKQFLSVIVLAALVVACLILLTVKVAKAAGDPIQEMWYTPFEDVNIRATPSLTGKVMGTAKFDTEYVVASYDWTPATAENSWACIKYRPYRRCGYVPVQIGDNIMGQVVYNLGIIYPQNP